jgi:hypothetical protein
MNDQKLELMLYKMTNSLHTFLVWMESEQFVLDMEIFIKCAIIIIIPVVLFLFLVRYSKSMPLPLSSIISVSAGILLFTADLSCKMFAVISDSSYSLGIACVCCWLFAGYEYVKSSPTRL